MTKVMDNIANFVNAFSKKERQQLTDRVSLVGVTDRYSTYPSKGLTPSKLATLLREADAGDIFRQMELFEEMLEKDAHLQALFQARRLAVTRRSYNIIPTSEEPRAKEIADDVDKMLKRIKSWNNATGNFLDCVPKAFSVCELQWAYRGDRLEVQRVRHQHQKKFRFGKSTDLYSDPEELRLLIDAHQIDSFRGLVPEEEIANATTDGVSIENNPALRLRFIPTYCKARSGNPARTSLLRTCTYLFLFKNYDVKWWISFAEQMLGYRIGKYDLGGADPAKQKELLELAVRGLATDSSAVISKDSAIEFAEMATKAQSHQVFGDLKDWCNAEMSELVLGHTGSSTSTPGKLGGEDMAQEVKLELVEADARAMDEAVTDYIVKPYADLNYGPQEEYPYYQTDVSQAIDMDKEASIGIKIQQMGGKLKAKTIKEKFGWPLANDDEEILVPQSNVQPPFPGTSVSAKDDGSADGKKKLLLSR